MKQLFLLFLQSSRQNRKHPFQTRADHADRHDSQNQAHQPGDHIHFRLPQFVADQRRIMKSRKRQQEDGGDADDHTAKMNEAAAAGRKAHHRCDRSGPRNDRNAERRHRDILFFLALAVLIMMERLNK